MLKVQELEDAENYGTAAAVLLKDKFVSVKVGKIWELILEKENSILIYFIIG